DFDGKVTVEAAYVGNRGKHLLQMLPGNYPAFGPGATLGNIEARRPIAGYGHVSMIHSRANSWYDALQLTADTRLFKGLTSRVTYVYQSNFGLFNNDPTGNTNQQTSSPLNWDLDKGPEGPKQVFRSFFIYDVPLLANSTSLMGKIAGAWQIAGSIYANSGSALNVDVGEDRNYDANTPDRPNITGPVEYSSGSADERSAGWLANAGVFVPATIGELGNLSRNAVRGPGAWGADMSVLKNFRFFEGKTIQFRAEAYNVLNHPNLGNPNLNLRNSDFNRIITRNGNRSMQMGFRFLF
ncbi:MAG TPA: hypothetical protein VEX68_10165, partial [Bryobacteraceae bacterium]|nr:hypothetical protein [Bryobacteraceae bacterium]